MTPTEPKFKLKVQLQPKQKQLYYAVIATGNVPTILGYGGSRGAAKSGGIRRIALLLAGNQPGVVIWIVRRIWDDLNKDHLKPLFQEYPELEEFYHAGDHEVRIPFGESYSSIFFVHSGRSLRSKQKARGPQAHYIFLEQAEEFSQQEIEQYDGSNRGPGTPEGFCKKILTFNPGGIGTNYLQRVMWQRRFHDNEDASSFSFIQGYGWDNYEWFRGLNLCTWEEFYKSPEWTDGTMECFSCQVRHRTIQQKCMDCEGDGRTLKRFRIFIEKTDFGKKLDKLPPAQRIGELMGSFENFSGQYYADVWEEKSIVLSAEDVADIIKPWWRRWLATDWGFSHYAATGWFASGMLSVEEIGDIFGVAAVAPVRVLIHYRELVVCDMAEPDLARLVLARTPEAERREMRYNFMGQDAWAKRGSANTVVEQIDPVLRTGGLPALDKADWDRVGGWRLLYNAFSSARRLRAWQGGSFDPFDEREENVPALFISAACPETIQAIPMLVCDYDPITRPNGDVKDVRKMPGQMHDDVADMLRYGLKSYLRAEPGLPKNVELAEVRKNYPQTAEGNTRFAMRMLTLGEQQEREAYLHRRVRGR